MIPDATLASMCEQDISLDGWMFFGEKFNKLLGRPNHTAVDPYHHSSVLGVQVAKPAGLPMLRRLPRQDQMQTVIAHLSDGLQAASNETVIPLRDPAARKALVIEYAV